MTGFDHGLIPDARNMSGPVGDHLEFRMRFGSDLDVTVIKSTVPMEVSPCDPLGHNWHGTTTHTCLDVAPARERSFWAVSL